MLRAPIPLDTPLTLENATLTGEDGALIGQAGPAKTLAGGRYDVIRRAVLARSATTTRD